MRNVNSNMGPRKPFVTFWSRTTTDPGRGRTGVCTVKSQAIYVLQKYRHVDNIMFENHTIVDRFLDYWRKTGNQRLGFLYGKYEHHKDVPLGIRATVAAIYEPPQVCGNGVVKRMN